MHPMKKCSKCQLLLDYFKFAKNKTKKDGYEPYCKSCKNEYNKSNYGNIFTQAYLKKGGYGIYMIKINPTEEIYIGKGWLNERKVDHFTKLKAKKHSNPYLQKSFNSSPNIEFIVLEKCEPELGSIKERDYIINEFMKNKNKILNQHVTLRWEK
jgi:hypothetical protein